MSITYRALSPLNRPTPGRKRRRSEFRVTPDVAIRHLEGELRRLAARDVVLELDCLPSHLWADGSRIKADARLDSPCVVLEFWLPQVGKVRYPCDSFDRWQDNLRALGLSLQALRAVDRYGVTQHREQYRGFLALPPARDGAMTVDEAADLITEASRTGFPGMTRDILLASRDASRLAIAAALKASHPDQGGTPERFHQVQRARKALLLHHGD